MVNIYHNEGSSSLSSFKLLLIQMGLARENNLVPWRLHKRRAKFYSQLSTL